MADDVLDNEIEYQTTDYGFAAYLATKPSCMFLEASPTGESSRRGKYPKMAFVFLVPKDEDMKQHVDDYNKGAEASCVPARVMFNKMRLMRQACSQPNTVKG